jgi:hypothetical protein
VFTLTGNVGSNPTLSAIHLESITWPTGHSFGYSKRIKALLSGISLGRML